MTTMNLTQAVRVELHQMNVDAVKTKTLATHDGLRVLSPEYQEMGHNLSFLSQKYPEKANDATKVNIGITANISIASDLIKELEAIDEKTKTAVVIETDPFIIGGKNRDISNRAEAFLFRHTTFNQAQNRGVMKGKYYSANHERKKQGKWNQVTGSNMVTYTYGVSLLAGAENNINQSELPLNINNASRLAKELFGKLPQKLNVIGFDAPRVFDSFYDKKVNRILYQKYYKMFEMLHKNGVKKTIITPIGVNAKMSIEAFKQAQKDFWYYKNKPMKLKEIVFVVPQEWAQYI